MRPAGFHHLAIQLHDLGRAEAFYCGVLGLQLARRWPWSPEQLAAGLGGDRSLWLLLGPDERSGFLALEACAGLPQASGFQSPAPGLHLVSLRIAAAERQAWEERLAAAGVPVVHRSRWTLYVLDPEGNRVGLSHHPDDPVT